MKPLTQRRIIVSSFAMAIAATCLWFSPKAEIRIIADQDEIAAMQKIKKSISGSLTSISFKLAV